MCIRDRQRWVRSSVRAASDRQTVVQQNSIEVLHQNINPLKQITGLSSLASTLFDTFLFACSLFCTQLAHQLVKHTCFALLTYDFIFFRSPTHYWLLKQGINFLCIFVDAKYFCDVIYNVIDKRVYNHYYVLIFALRVGTRKKRNKFFEEADN